MADVYKRQLSALIFPSQAQGTLVMADGVAVGAKNVGQEFTEDYFMWSRPSAYHYNTYYEEDTDGDGQVEQYYNDGSAFAGLSSGSNNSAPSNPALAERVEADIAAFLEKNPGVSREDIPTDLMTASGSGLDPHISPASADAVSYTHLPTAAASWVPTPPLHWRTPPLFPT